MVNVQNLTPEEAQTYLLKLQEKTRKRQRNYVKRKKQEGRRRVNTFLRPEATQILQREQQQSGRSSGDILSDALLVFAKYHHQDISDKPQIKRSAQPNVTANVSRNDGGDIPSRDYRPAEKRIVELDARGFNLTEIVNQLEAERIPTATGKLQWHRTTVSRIIKRFKKT